MGHYITERLIAYCLIYIALFIDYRSRQRRKRDTSSRIVALTLLPASLLITDNYLLFSSLTSHSCTLCLFLFILFLLGFWCDSPKTKFSLIALVGIIGLGLASGVEYFFEEMLQPHQQSRILVSLGMKDDPQGRATMYAKSQLQSDQAGSLARRIYARGFSKAQLCTEQDTDFIFAFTVGRRIWVLLEQCSFYSSWHF